MNRPGSIRVVAPAKLNLGLWITRRRPDDYHDLVTIFQAIDLCDELEVTPAPRGLTLACDKPGIPTGAGNLVIQAARLLRDTALAPRHRSRGAPLPGARFRLTKRIPAGSGLGGGSSDAAAALVALNSLWDLRLSAAALRRLALQVGSDVPFFLLGGTGVGRGRGERLTPLRLSRPFHFVLVHSSAKISTKWAYSQFKNGLTRFRPLPRILALSPGERFSGIPIKGFYNALEAGLVARYPDIGTRRQRLLALGARTALLTGSGSTVYGIFSRPGEARVAALELQREGFEVDLCRSVGHGVAMAGDVGR